MNKGEVIVRTVASIAICSLGAISMFASDGASGIGWAIIGVSIIWLLGVGTSNDKPK